MILILDVLRSTKYDLNSTTGTKVRPENATTVDLHVRSNFQQFLDLCSIFSSDLPFDSVLLLFDNLEQLCTPRKMFAYATPS